jgi:hydrogenase nickel incorporation protein HypB
VVVLSVTEGVDKPLKYPVMFRKADLVVLTKVDLLPYLPGVSVAAIRENLGRVMPSARAIEVSATTGLGMTDFIDWLDQRRADKSVPAG